LAIGVLDLQNFIFVCNFDSVGWYTG
jgi:hypothetical protein